MISHDRQYSNLVPWHQRSRYHSWMWGSKRWWL